MPQKPKKPCAYPGCPRLTNHRYCDEHARLEARRYEKSQRNPQSKRRYGHDWEILRDRYIHSHPLCELCAKEKKLIPANLVHHILPLAEGGTNDESNLQSLCTTCHSRLHAKRGDRWPGSSGTRRGGSNL